MEILNLYAGLILVWSFTILLIFFVCAEIKKYEEQYHTIEIPNEEAVVTYFKIRQQLAKLGKEIQEFIHKPKYCLPFLQPGRLVKVVFHTLTVWWQKLEFNASFNNSLFWSQRWKTKMLTLAGVSL